MTYLLISQLRDILYVNVKGNDPSVQLLVGKTLEELISYLKYMPVTVSKNKEKIFETSFIFVATFQIL